VANILTEIEASAVLRVEPDDQIMLDILPQVDAYIKLATGRDWAADDLVRPEAKSAARMLLVKWYEDPGAMGVAFGGSLGFGLSAALLQLEAIALDLEYSATPTEPLAIIASMPVSVAKDISPLVNLILVFNHEMSPAAIASVSLEDADGGVVATTNTLDPAKKIMTIAPQAGLLAATGYQLKIQAAADVYGLTLSHTIRFTTV
jgi:hypothetical protein